MKIIDDLYKPDVILLPVGQEFTMNAREAAYALKNFFPTPKIVVPMYLNSNVDLTIADFDFDGFVALCNELGVEGKQIIHPRDFFGGKAVLE